MRARFSTATSTPSPVLPAPIAKQGLMLLEDITCGTHYAALNTAIIGSCFNAIAHRRRYARQQPMRNYLPRAPSARPQWGRLMQEMRQPEGLVSALPLFFSHLAVVEKQAEHISNEIQAHGLANVAQAHAGRMLQASRQMSEIAITAIQSLDKISNGSLPLSYARNMIMLRSFLADVVGGGSPLVDRDGNILVPELPQRRVLQRKPVYLRAILEHKGKSSPVIVINISITGAALENAPPLVPKSVVVLEIGTRCLAATVVWDRGSSAAIKFDMPLKEEDPLLA